MPDAEPIESPSGTGGYSPPLQKRRPLLRWVFWLVGLAALALVGIMAVWYARVEALSARGFTFLADVLIVTPDGRVRQLTPGDGIYHFATLRPDSSRIVY